MKIAEDGAGIVWFGRLDTTPPDLDWGRLNYWKSFATLYTKPWERDYGRKDKLKLTHYNCFELRIRGDGRRYELDATGNRIYDNSTSMWTTPIFTRGGFEWETIRVPFYHMFQQFQDTKVRDQNFLSVEGIWELRFRIQDDIAGPFKLEIDYIAVAHDFAFDTFHNSHFLNIEVKNSGMQDNGKSNSQSIKNHYFHDPYNKTLRKTANPNNDVFVQRLEPEYGFYGNNH